MNFISDSMNASVKGLMPAIRRGSPTQALGTERHSIDGIIDDGDGGDGDASDASYHAILEQVEGSSDAEQADDVGGEDATSPLLHKAGSRGEVPLLSSLDDVDGDAVGSSQDAASKPSADSMSKVTDVQLPGEGPQDRFRPLVPPRHEKQPSIIHVLIQRLAGNMLENNRARDLRTTRRPSVFSAQWSCSRMEYSTITEGGLEGKRSNQKNNTKRSGAHPRGDGAEGNAASSAEPPEVVFATQLFGLRYASTAVEDAFIVFLYRGRRSFLSFSCATVSAVALAASVVTDAFDSFWIGALLCLLGVALFGIGSVNYIWFVLAKSYERRDAPKLATSLLYEMFCIAFGVLGTVALAVPHYPLAEVCISIGHYELVPTIVEPCVDYMGVLNLIAPIILAVLLPLRAKFTIPIILIAPWMLLLVRVWYPAGSNITAWLQLACQTALALGFCLIAWCNETASRRMFADSICIKADVKRTFKIRKELDRALEALLPKYVVRQMAERRSVVDHAEMAMVSVCEIHDFANWTTTLLPADIVHVINALFMAFDEVVWRYELDKMKAVGDRYIVTSGLQRRDLALTAAYEAQCDAERHHHTTAAGGGGSATHAPFLSTDERQQREMAIRCVRAALIQLRVAAQLNQKLDTPLKLKVVLHCGPLLGALVGSRSISYDMFGPTLEVPLRMATHIHHHGVAIYSDEMRFCCDGFFRDAPLPPLALMLNGVGEQTFRIHRVFGSSQDTQKAEGTKPIKMTWPGMETADDEDHPTPAVAAHADQRAVDGRGATSTAATAPHRSTPMTVLDQASQEGQDRGVEASAACGDVGGRGAMGTPASFGAADQAVPEGFCIPSTMVSQLELRRHPMASSGASTSSTMHTDGTGDGSGALHGRLDMSLSLGSRKSMHSRGTPSLSLQQHPLFARELGPAVPQRFGEATCGDTSGCSSVDCATTVAGTSSVNANLMQAVSFFQQERYRVLTEMVLREKERQGTCNDQLAPAAKAIKQHLEATAVIRFHSHRRSRSTLLAHERRREENPLSFGDGASQCGSSMLATGGSALPDHDVPPSHVDLHRAGSADLLGLAPASPLIPSRRQPPLSLVAAAGEPVPLHGRRLYHDIAAATRTIRGSHLWGSVVHYRLPELEHLFDTYLSSAFCSVSQGAYAFHMGMCVVFVVTSFVESMYLVHTHERAGALPRPNAAAGLLRGADILGGHVPSSMNSAFSLPLAAVSLVVAAVRCASLSLQWHIGHPDSVDSTVLVALMVCTMLSVHAMPDNALNMDLQYLLLYFLLLIGAVVRFWYHAAVVSCIGGALMFALQAQRPVGIRGTTYVTCLPIAFGVCIANVYKERYCRTHFEALWLSSALLQAADDEVAIQHVVQTLMFPRHVLSVVNKLCLGVVNPDMVFLQSISDLVTLEVRLDTVTERVWRQRHHPLAAIDFAERSFYMIETLVAQANEAARRRQPRLIGSRDLIFRVHSCGDSILYAGSLDDLKDEGVDEGGAAEDAPADERGIATGIATVPVADDTPQSSASSAESNRRAFASWKHATVSSPMVHKGQGGKRHPAKHAPAVIEDDEWVVEEKRSWECSFAMMEVLSKLFQLRKRQQHERTMQSADAQHESVTQTETASAQQEWNGSTVSTTNPAASMTCVVCSGSGFATVLGSRRVTFDVFGVVTRQSATLLQAAPPGFFGCSDAFKRLLGDAQANAGGGGAVRESPLPLDVAFAAAQQWRVRGAGVMIMHTLVDANTVMVPASRDVYQDTTPRIQTFIKQSDNNCADAIAEEVRQATLQYHNSSEALPVNFSRLADSPAHSASTCTDDDGEEVTMRNRGNSRTTIGSHPQRPTILRFDFVECSEDDEA